MPEQAARAARRGRRQRLLGQEAAAGAAAIAGAELASRAQISDSMPRLAAARAAASARRGRRAPGRGPARSIGAASSARLPSMPRGQSPGVPSVGQPGQHAPEGRAAAAPTLMPGRPHRRARGWRVSCAPVRFLSTEIALRSSPARLEVPEHHHRVGEIADVDGLSIDAPTRPCCATTISVTTPCCPRKVRSSWSCRIRKRSSGIALR